MTLSLAAVFIPILFMGGIVGRLFREFSMVILVAILVIFLVLGILYESFIHPLTILSGLPSAGFGSLVAGPPATLWPARRAGARLTCRPSGDSHDECQRAAAEVRRRSFRNPKR